ncbi:hypothetical protein [Candidatus Electronema sp. JM]|uniref:hypothetical protein n=1 Tax=Candidatus Electronema sp. JM TaxID=3401571 RepID=UPI003AA83A7D
MIECRQLCVPHYTASACQKASCGKKEGYFFNTGSELLLPLLIDFYNNILLFQGNIFIGRSPALAGKTSSVFAAGEKGCCSAVAEAAVFVV